LKRRICRDFKIEKYDFDKLLKKPKVDEDVASLSPKIEPTAQLDDLVDLVDTNGEPEFLLLENGELQFKDEIPCVDLTMVPPKMNNIPFRLVPSNVIGKHINDNDHDIYWEVFGVLKQASVLPSEAHYHLCTVYIFFTYVWESASYYPYLWFFGLPERGKSRIVKAIIQLCYRGLYTETLNEAFIFRFADLFRGTLALDLYELSEKAQKKGSHDLLLGRYERGMIVPRVTNPDRGPFNDTQFYKVSGPTIIATNVEIPSKDPLRSRCIKITMPEARGKYPNISCDNSMVELKAGLLVFRSRYLGKPLPEVEKPVSGRLGDIVHPLIGTARLLPSEASENLMSLIVTFESERKETESESLAGKIAQGLYDLRNEVQAGRLPVEKIREKINAEIDPKYCFSPQRIGRELSAMGFEKVKSVGKMLIIFDEKLVGKIWERFLPNLPNLPNDDGAGVSGGETKSDNPPHSTDEREKTHTHLSAQGPCLLTDREAREEREISSWGNEDEPLVAPDEVTI
jgi:hypothetical protein